MGKPFFEVFPVLKLEGNVHAIMEQTLVEKVSSTKKKDFLRVYIKSNRLITKEDIWYTEQCIKNQLFPNIGMIVKLYEHFELSAQYTPEKLMDVYYESILAEIQDYSHVMYNIFKNAQFAYPTEVKMIMNLEDTVIARSKEEELTEILQKILVERCGFSLELYVEYREASGSKYAAEDEMKIKQEVAQIYQRVTRNKETAGADKGDAFVEPSASVETKTVEKTNAKADTAAGTTKGKQETSAKTTTGKGEYKKGDFAKGTFKRD
ncbi:MAG: PolC-type DNA polymerase III, partial [Lachnospiraceae bacterium]|nr:PolC-type DNA polymerase III [Lachnospiraceae bacterium]